MDRVGTLILVSVVLASGCINGEIDGETGGESNSIKPDTDSADKIDSPTSKASNSDIRILYNITHREGNEIRSSSQSEYLVESGKVRMIESESETQYWPPSNREENNLTIVCGETCDIDSAETRYIDGPALNPDLEDSTNIGSKEIGGNECERYLISDISDTDKHFTGIFFGTRNAEVTHCVGNEGIIYETTVTEDDQYESRSEIVEYNELESQEVEERLEIPEVAISGSINRVCDSNEFDIVVTQDLDEVELVILDTEGPRDAESLDDLESIDSSTIDIDESWKEQSANFEVDEDRFIIAPVINGEILDKGSFSCIY